MLRILLKSMFLASILGACGSVFAQDGFAGALRDVAHPSAFSTRLAGSNVALADFDGDRRLDGVVLEDDGSAVARNHKIRLHLSADNNSDITFVSSEDSLQLAAIDIDGDGDVDLVVERPFGHERLFVWLNDGKGHFSSGRAKDSLPASENFNHVAGSLVDNMPETVCALVHNGVDCVALARDSLGTQALPKFIIGCPGSAPVGLDSRFGLPSRSPPPLLSL